VGVIVSITVLFNKKYMDKNLKMYVQNLKDSLIMKVYFQQINLVLRSTPVLLSVQHMQGARNGR
jgi:hypothetical protein